MKPVEVQTPNYSNQPAVMRTDEFGQVQLRLLDRVTARNTHKLSELDDSDYLTQWRTPQELGITHADILDTGNGLPLTAEVEEV